jgi:hypothetical protein
MVDWNGNSDWNSMGWNELFTSFQIVTNSSIFLNFAVNSKFR